MRMAAENRRRQDRANQSRRGGLIEFVRYFWHVLEPQTPLVDGWAMEAICQHLEAVTAGEIQRLLINVPPGFAKSVLTQVYWPAWQWGPMNMPHLRLVSFSYAASLTLRDNTRFRDLVMSQEYQKLWGKRYGLRKIGEEKVTNDKTGWKLASSVGGVATGERGNVVILDDPHSVKEAESEVVRSEAVRWFRESMSNRLNDLEHDSIVVIMQRVHENDVSGAILSDDFDYTHLCIPMEYEEDRCCKTSIGWSDPRTEEGELAWSERFPAEAVERMKRELGPFAYASQYRQSPEPRGGGIIKRDWWQLWPSESYPPCEYVLASLDTAYTEKKENDPSALTIWGVFRDTGGNPKVVLLYAWQGREELHGLVTKVAAMCDLHSKDKTVPHFPVDRLIIEGKASGISIAQELRRLYGNVGSFGVEIIDPTKWGDKVARMYAVQHMFSDDMIFAPDREFAEMVIDQVAAFPRATHDDLADSVSQALRYLRLTGLLLRKEEYASNQAELLTYRSKDQPLYDV